MTLQQLKNRINSLGVTKQQKIEAYQDMRKDLFDKVGKQQMYHSEAELRLEHFKKEADDYFNTEYSSIINQLERIEKSELEVIKSQYEKVTADDVAELNLLASMEVSEQELLEYLDRFKRNPLAIKKLHEIGTVNSINLPGYTFKEERLADLVQVFRQYAKTFYEAPIIDNAGSASELAFVLILSGDELSAVLDKYLNHFDTALNLE